MLPLQFLLESASYHGLGPSLCATCETAMEIFVGVGRLGVNGSTRTLDQGGATGLLRTRA